MECDSQGGDGGEDNDDRQAAGQLIAYQLYFILPFFQSPILILCARVRALAIFFLGIPIKVGGLGD